MSHSHQHAPDGLMPFRFAMRTEQDLEDGLDVSRADDGIDAERLHVLGWTDGEEVVR